MTKIDFCKMTGGGNDFVVINLFRYTNFNFDKAELSKRLCRRCFSIGADGVIFIEPSSEADFFYRHINLDGSLAAICGNGTRCISLYAFTNKIAGRKMCFQSPAGNFKATVDDNHRDVTVDFVPGKNIRLHIPLNIFGNNYDAHFINTGVPHAVIFTDDLEGLDIAKIGHEVVHHQEFQPDMTNANFITIEDEKTIKIRTYERGVEYETLACGTGSISSAVIAAALGKIKPPADVHTRGGMLLQIDFSLVRDPSGNVIGAENITMKGEAEIVFHGTIDI